MKLTRPPRRAAPETIVALIDVIFFLLVFFMLIGRMDATAPFRVMPPASDSGSEMPGGGATVSVGAAGELALNGAGTGRAALLAGIKRELAAKPGLLVRVNAARGAELRHVLPLVAAIEGLGARDVVLVVTPATP